MFPSIVVIKDRNPFSEQRVKAAVEEAMKKTAVKAEKLFHEVDSTWRHGITVIKSPVKPYGSDYEMDIYTDDDIFWWLDNGVPRHAKMDKDFVRKTNPTRPATFKSGGGGGNPDPLWITKYPLGYIEPRNWTITMADLMREELRNNLKRAFGPIFSQYVT